MNRSYESNEAPSLGYSSLMLDGSTPPRNAYNQRRSGGLSPRTPRTVAPDERWQNYNALTPAYRYPLNDATDTTRSALYGSNYSALAGSARRQFDAQNPQSCSPFQSTTLGHTNRYMDAADVLRLSSLSVKSDYFAGNTENGSLSDSVLMASPIKSQRKASVSMSLTHDAPEELFSDDPVPLSCGPLFPMHSADSCEGVHDEDDHEENNVDQSREDSAAHRRLDMDEMLLADAEELLDCTTRPRPSWPLSSDGPSELAWILDSPSNLKAPRTRRNSPALNDMVLQSAPLLDYFSGDAGISSAQSMGPPQTPTSHHHQSHAPYSWATINIGRGSQKSLECGVKDEYHAGIDYSGESPCPQRDWRWSGGEESSPYRTSESGPGAPRKSIKSSEQDDYETGDVSTKNSVAAMTDIDALAGLAFRPPDYRGSVREVPVNTAWRSSSSPAGSTQSPAKKNMEHLTSPASTTPVRKRLNFQNQGKTSRPSPHSLGKRKRGFSWNAETRGQSRFAHIDWLKEVEATRASSVALIPSQRNISGSGEPTLGTSQEARQGEPGGRQFLDFRSHDTVLPESSELDDVEHLCRKFRCLEIATPQLPHQQVQPYPQQSSIHPSSFPTAESRTVRNFSSQTELMTVRAPTR